MIKGPMRANRPVQKTLNILVFAGVFVGLCLLPGYGAHLHGSGKREGDILFNMSPSSFYDGKVKTRLEVYYDVPYDQLGFTKRDTVYTASFDISVIFYDAAGEQVGGDIWRRRVVVNSYEETKVLTRRFASHEEFHILPGTYWMRVKLEDLSSGRFSLIQEEVEVRQFGRRKVELSDPVFLHFFSDTLTSPNPSRDYLLDTRVGVRFEIYGSAETDSSQIEASLVDSNGKVWNSGLIPLGGASPETKTVVFSVDTLPRDSFSLVIRLADTVLARWPFRVSHPFYLDTEEYLQRVEAMRYIATDEEMERLRKAPPDERAAAYSDFWKEKDPVPSTERNEAEREYFARVAYSNRHFGGLIPGWKTDRGMIYIQYGRPDEVEKHPFEIDQPPYELWYYYSSGQRFVFVDEHNLGTYELKGWRGR